MINDVTIILAENLLKRFERKSTRGKYQLTGSITDDEWMALHTVIDFYKQNKS